MVALLSNSIQFRNAITMSTPTISVLIADDQKLIRDTWTSILALEPGFQVVAEAADGEEAIQLGIWHRPDLILMDIVMSPVNGVTAIKELLSVSTAFNILAVSMYAQPWLVKQIMKTGAKGYITKNTSRKEFLQAAHQTAKGLKFICDEVKTNLTEDLILPHRSRSINQLTKREIEIAELICKGLTSKEISGQIDIQQKTVEVHRNNIIRKLRVKNTADLVNFMYAAGLLIHD
ncbi:MAG: hypothetical protein A1D16_03000 [Flavihumibacter sp. CACIAM 22H1]|nr:MAG: hypothetical protein A1D16_03000 [Flavihumibacter sp. CACIAM 22H1]